MPRLEVEMNRIRFILKGFLIILNVIGVGIPGQIWGDIYTYCILNRNLRNIRIPQGICLLGHSWLDTDYTHSYCLNCGKQRRKFWSPSAGLDEGFAYWIEED